MDTITDFRVVDDTMRLENSIFTAIGARVEAREFLANTTGLAGDAHDRLIYEKDIGELYCDRNGDGAGGAVLITVLGKSLALTHTDFAMI